MISLLLSFYLASFSAEDSNLIKALNRGNIEQIKSLAQVSSELNWKDTIGNDALFYAISLNEPDITQVLLDAGASTKNLYTEKKESLLFEATRLGSEAILKILLKKDPSLLKIKNTENESPLFEAVREDQSQIVRFFLKKGLSIKEKNTAGKTPIFYVDPKNKKMVALFKELKLSK